MRTTVRFAFSPPTKSKEGLLVVSGSAQMPSISLKICLEASKTAETLLSLLTVMGIGSNPTEGNHG